MASTIIIGLAAGIVAGIYSGLFVARKISHDNKRLYARQINEDFSLVSTLIFISATSYLESFGYNVQDFDSSQPSMEVKANQAVVNRIRKEYERDGERRLLKHDASKLIAQVEGLAKDVLNDTTGFKSFFNKYPLQASYFDVLYQVLSAVDLLTCWRNEIQTRSDIEYTRICVSNVTAYLLDILDGLLKASSEIKYYCKVQAWTWRLIIPTFRN